jgi:ubiquinone/menaquinone biosynthesis C-methylase UbiE
VFPSGSLNHADLQMPAVVATWSTVFSVGKSDRLKAGIAPSQAFTVADMGLRGSILAFTYDHQLKKSEQAGLGDLRQRLLAQASGDVLEIGGGTGANLPYYGPLVASLTTTDPAPAMLRRLRKRAAELRPRAEVVRAAAEKLPFEDDSFDTVVSTLVLCGVADQAQALSEVRRVLQPGGRLIFIEHVRSDDPGLARFQDRINWLNRAVVCCDCNRQTLASIQAEGFEVADLARTELPRAPNFVRPLIAGTATVS